MNQQKHSYKGLILASIINSSCTLFVSTLFWKLIIRNSSPYSSFLAGRGTPAYIVVIIFIMLYQAVVVIATSVYYKYLVDNRITSRKFIKIFIPIIIGTFSLAIIIYYLFESLQILFSFINN